ncbi:MAG: hypothetical protein U1E76_05415 [Planctomycetota bacterium]
MLVLLCGVQVRAPSGAPPPPAPTGVHLTGDSRWWPAMLGADAQPRDWLLPLPPLGWIGSYHYPDESASGILSPWLSAGRVTFCTASMQGSLSGADLPLLGCSLWRDARLADDRGDAWVDRAILEWSLPFHRQHPCELFSLVHSAAAGPESDLRLLSVLGASLLRVQTDVTGTLVDADLVRFPRGLVLNRGAAALHEAEHKVREIQPAGELPVAQRTSALGPVFRYERRAGEQALALRPLFAWDSERGLSLPWAAATIGGSEAGFPSAEALAHLFPLVSRGANPSYYDVLWPFGAVYTGERFTIVDLKFLAQVQWGEERGAMLGLLPFPIGSHPHDAFTRDFPQYHLRGHLLSWWRLDRESHFSLAEPLVFRYHDASQRAHHPEHAIDVGPFGLLFRERADESALRSSSLFTLLHWHEQKNDGRSDTDLGPLGTLLQVRGTVRGREYRLLTVPFLQASLLRFAAKDADRDVEILPAPFLSLLQYHADEDASELSLGPFSCLCDLSFGPDRFSCSLTPLLKFERLGQSQRLRVLFIDAFSTGVFAEPAGSLED